MLIPFAASARSAAAAQFGRTLVFCSLVSFTIDSALAIDFSVGPKEVIYTAKQRKSRGISSWPDGNLGVVANGHAGYDFYAANGPKPVKTTGPLTDPGRSRQSVSITNLPKKTFDYVSGGPVYQDPASGARLMIYHAEKHGKNKKDFYSVLGLAVSTDSAGLTFQDLGTIIEPSLQTGQTEVGGGSFAVVDNHLHVYYRDWFSGGWTSEVAVARAPLNDLINNALSGRGTEFSKYFYGNWSQPGRGGLSSPLEIGNPNNSWLSVSHNDYLDQLVMVTSQWEGGGGDLYLSTSSDGINWSARQPIAFEAGEQFYPSLIGTGSDPTHTGKSFYVYYTDSQRGAWDRWKDAQLVRREITLDPAMTPPEPPIPPPPPPTQPPIEPPVSQPTDWISVADLNSDFQTGNPAHGWTYAWNPNGNLGDSAAFAPLYWSDEAYGYNTTGGATTVPGRKKKKQRNHNDDYLVLNAAGGHPGRPGYVPIAGYTIQAEDGEGFYRLSETSIAKADSVLSSGEDGLEVMVYVNDAASGLSQFVSTNGESSTFDRELGQLDVGDTVWVMVSPFGNHAYDAFTDFDFSIQKSVPAMAALMAAATVPEPSTVTLLFMAFVCALSWRRRQ
jgi:hypothetical protein